MTGLTICGQSQFWIFNIIPYLKNETVNKEEIIYALLSN